MSCSVTTPNYAVADATGDGMAADCCRDGEIKGVVRPRETVIAGCREKRLAVDTCESLVGRGPFRPRRPSAPSAAFLLRECGGLAAQASWRQQDWLWSCPALSIWCCLRPALGGGAWVHHACRAAHAGPRRIARHRAHYGCTKRGSTAGEEYIRHIDIITDNIPPETTRN